MLHMEQNIDYELETISFLSNERVHARELSRRLNINHMKIKRVLDNLAKKNVVDSVNVGKNREFYLKENLQSRIFILSAELYKQSKILENIPELKIIFEKKTKTISRLAQNAIQSRFKELLY